MQKFGLHCPADVVQDALKVAAETPKQAVPARNDCDLERDCRLLLQYFPGIPSTDVDEIVEHRLGKGSGRLSQFGRLGGKIKSDEDTKIELVVTAHIRQNFTDYDEYWTQMFKGIKFVRTKEQIRELFHDQVQSIAASWHAVDRDVGTTVDSDVRRSTRWAKKNPDPMRDAERQNCKDNNTNKVYKTRASEAKKIDEATLYQALECLNSDRITEAMGSLKSAPRRRTELGSFRRKEKGKKELPYISTSDNLITNDLNDNHDYSANIPKSNIISAQTAASITLVDLSESKLASKWGRRPRMVRKWSIARGMRTWQKSRMAF
jgi:hypothetical protein